jgi:hypothetical protein
VVNLKGLCQLLDPDDDELDLQESRKHRLSLSSKIKKSSEEIDLENEKEMT